MSNSQFHFGDARIPRRHWKRIHRHEITGCWLWYGGTNKAGYGYTMTKLGRLYTHRWFYLNFSGPIPDGLEIDHLCRVRNCVNPEHLEAVTPEENKRRGPGRQRKACVNGHEFTDDNVYWRKDSGKRQCRQCKRDRDEKYRAEGRP